VLEPRRRAGRAQTILVLLALGITAVLIWQFVSFQDALGRLPRGWTVAGASVAGQKPQDVVLRLRPVLSQTVTLHYRAETLTLAPQDVDLTLDVTATLQALNAARADVATGSEGFLYYLSQRVPPPRNIAIAATLSEVKLRAFLSSVAEKYDTPPTSPAPLIEELRFVAGQPGSELDISASVPLIASALQSASRREVNLVVNTVAPVPPSLALLHDLLEAYLKRNFRGQAGVFVKDLQTGEEIGVNEAAAFSGLGLLKLPIMTETYRRVSSGSNTTTLHLITQSATGEGDNAAANTLLQLIGDSDAFAGADRVNSSLRYLGLVNTFIAVPYDQNIRPPAIVTRANSRLDLNTNPDARMQTTPEDTGLLLEMIYQCAHGGGALIIAFPKAFSPDECTGLLDLLSQATLTDPNDNSPMFIRAGLPAGVQAANKWSWDKETRANAAVVFAPNGNFVLVIFMQQVNWGDWQLATPVMADVTRAAYSYFTLPR
jgi:beta-lactamase class A